MIRNLLLTAQPDTLLGGRIANVIEGLGLPGGDTVEALFVLVLIVAIAYVLGRVAVIPFVDRLMDHREVDRHLQLTLLKVVHLLVLSGAVGVGLYISGYTFLLGALAAAMAAGGLSIGFALQGAVRNVVAGMFIYAEKPFRIGDEIEWDDNFGIVQDISLRVTRIQSFDNKLITVPNSKLTDGVTKNPVRSGPLRLGVNIPIDLKADIAEAKEIIIAEAENHEKILDNPAPAAPVMDFEESRVLLEARIWLPNREIGNRVKIRDEFATAVKASLEEAGIDIPYPHRRLSRAPDDNSEVAGESNVGEPGGDDVPEADELETDESTADEVPETDEPDGEGKPEETELTAEEKRKLEELEDDERSELTDDEKRKLEELEDEERSEPTDEEKRKAEAD